MIGNKENKKRNCRFEGEGGRAATKPAGRKSFGRRMLLFLLGAVLLATTGCGKLVFVTGLDRDELFNVGDQSGSCREMRVYLTTMENQYKEAYGDDVFTRSGNETVGDSLKENALERLVKVKVLNQIADEVNVSLDETEVSDARQAAKDYYASLSETEQKYLGISEQDAVDMLQDYRLAAKMAEEMTSGVPDEVSDDEARTVTVQSILIKTYTEGADGSRTEFSDSQKEDARKRAIELRDKIQYGMDNMLGITFDTYIAEYNEDSVSTYTLGQGDADTAFVQAAFNQPVGTISDVVETADGYRILKPIATSDESQLESNKEAILEKRIREAYESAYDEKASKLDCQLNEDRWNQVTLCEDSSVTTDSFFAVCAGSDGDGGTSS